MQFIPVKNQFQLDCLVATLLQTKWFNFILRFSFHSSSAGKKYKPFKAGNTQSYILASFPVFTLALHNQHHVSGMSPNLLECSRHSEPKQWRAISCSLNKCVCCWFPSDWRRGGWYSAPSTWGDDDARDEGPAESRHHLQRMTLLLFFFFLKLLWLLIASHEKGKRRWDSGCSDLSPSGPLRMPPWTVLCSQAL